MLKKTATKSKGLGMATPIASKNTGRRALGELSSAKLNTVNRLAQQSGYGTDKKNGAPTGNNTGTGKQKDLMSNSLGMLSFKLALDTDDTATAPLNAFGGTDSDMICSSSTTTEDPHDCVVRKAAALDVVLLPAAHVENSAPVYEEEQDWSTQFQEKGNSHGRYSDSYSDNAYDTGGYDDSASDLCVFSLPQEEPDFD